MLTAYDPGKQYYPPMNDQGSPSNDTIFNNFITAIKCSSLEQVENILQNNDPSIVNRIEAQFRQPSLYFAALVPGDEESAELIKLLIRNGANVQYKDHNEQTILFYICRQGKENCAELLLSHGLSLDDVDIYGQTPLFYAVGENRLEIVSKYATRQRVNHVDKLAKQTPVYYAARKGHFDMSKLLFEKGSDLTHLDSSNKTVVQYAKKAKFSELAQFLSQELRKIREITKNNSAEENSDRKGKKSKEDLIRQPKQTYKLVFCPQKGEPRDLSEADVKKLLADKPELAAFMANPESIPSEELSSVQNDSWDKAATKVLNQCCKLKGAFYFMEPVDPAKLNVMDYFDIVTQPMDLGTVRRKLTHNCYRQPQEFIVDMNLIWQNSFKYNGDTHVVSKCAKEIQLAFNNMVISHGLSQYLQQPTEQPEKQPQQSPEVRQEQRQEVRQEEQQEERQEVRQEERQEVRQEERQEVRQEERHEVRQEERQEVRPVEQAAQEISPEQQPPSERQAEEAEAERPVEEGSPERPNEEASESDQNDSQSLSPVSE